MNGVNAHDWRKLKQAERNTLRVTYGCNSCAKFRRLKYWTRAFNRALDKAIPLPKPVLLDQYRDPGVDNAVNNFIKLIVDTGLDVEVKGYAYGTKTNSETS